MIIVVGLLIFNVYQYKGESLQCLSNPLLYGAQKLSEQNGYDFVAKGYFISQSQTPTVYISNYGVEMSFDLQSPIVQENIETNNVSS